MYFLVCNCFVVVLFCVSFVWGDLFLFLLLGAGGASDEDASGFTIENSDSGRMLRVVIRTEEYKGGQQVYPGGQTVYVGYEVVGM